jgi:hypothetical protein
MSNIHGRVLTICILLSLLVPVLAQADYIVSIKIHRIVKIDEIEGFGQGGADWFYYVGVSEDGQTFDVQKSPVPVAQDKDDVVVDAIHRFRVKHGNMVVAIRLGEHDITTPDDLADISSRQGGGYDDVYVAPPNADDLGGHTYVGYYNAETGSLTGDATTTDGEYYSTSGDYDGSTDVDENDAAVYFSISSTSLESSSFARERSVTYTMTDHTISANFATVCFALSNAIKPGESEVVTFDMVPSVSSVGLLGKGFMATFNTPIGHTSVSIYNTPVSSSSADITGNLSGKINVSGSGYVDTNVLEWTDWGTMSVNVTASSYAKNCEIIRVSLAPKYKVSMNVTSDVLGKKNTISSVKDKVLSGSAECYADVQVVRPSAQGTPCPKIVQEDESGARGDPISTAVIVIGLLILAYLLIKNR